MFDDSSHRLPYIGTLKTFRVDLRGLRAAMGALLVCVLGPTHRILALHPELPMHLETAPDEHSFDAYTEPERVLLWYKRFGGDGEQPWIKS